MDCSVHRRATRIRGEVIARHSQHCTAQHCQRRSQHQGRYPATLPLQWVVSETLCLSHAATQDPLDEVALASPTLRPRRRARLLRTPSIASSHRWLGMCPPECHKSWAAGADHNTRAATDGGRFDKVFVTREPSTKKPRTRGFVTFPARGPAASHTFHGQQPPVAGDVSTRMP